jgi:metal transporter CNNM
MSGLTVGYLSIDSLTIDLKLKTGTPTDKVRARKVISVIKHRHLLLVTLLMANAACMEALPIFLDSIFPTYIAIIVSVTCVLFFGEIIPQAACVGPHQIAIAAFLAPMTKCLMWILILLGFPLSKILDYVLGHHELTRFNNKELKALIGLHSAHALKNTKLTP